MPPSRRRLAGWAGGLLVLAAAGPAGAQAPDPSFLDAVMVQLNEARTRPDDYAGRLRTWRALFEGDQVVRRGQPSLVTVEGVAAVDEAIAFLEDAAPLARVARSRRLDRAAADHVADQSGSGATGHEGADGNGPTARMARYGRWRATAEVIAYGAETPEAVVIQLIVDDGVPGRGHRRILFNPTYTMAGVSCGPHPVYRRMCVINFARRHPAP